MKILIADDDATSRKLLGRVLKKWGFEVIVAEDGIQAWGAIQETDAQIVILDWMMPGMEGVEVCRKIRSREGQARYVILLTSKTGTEDIVEGLDAGADDYIHKPFSKTELRARIRAGERILELQNALSERIQSLEQAMSQIRTLEGIIPICMYCHKIRNDKESWERIEKYITENSNAQFSHGLCPDCKVKFMAKADDGPDLSSPGS